MPTSSILKLLGILHQGKSCASFQDDQFVPTTARGFQDYGGAGNRDGHGAGFDAAAAGILRDAQENRAAVDLGVAPGLVETENRVCAEAGDGEIGESKFERESPPVRTPVSSRTLSFTTAGRAAASEGRILTSRIIWVTRASFFESAAMA